MMRSFTMLFLLLCITACMVKCSGAWGAECKLEWDTPAPIQQVTSWKIYRGLDLLATVTTPAVTLDLPADARSTLSVVAINVTATSPPATITVVPFTPRHSEDLSTWTLRPAKVLFIEAKPKIFANFSFPTQ